MENQELQPSDYRIRKLIGILGLCLPLLLPIAGSELLSSMSHYYYKALPALIFIIILSSFGLFLISYKGYQFDPKTEKISDDVITNIGGVAALIVVFVPTYCLESGSDFILNLCNANTYPLLGHSDTFLNAIHLVAAGVFIFTMGWMSKYKFTRSINHKNNKLYQICGNIVWLAIALLIALFIADLIKDGFQITPYDVFILETVAVIPFAISWLVKGITMNATKTSE